MRDNYSSWSLVCFFRNTDELRAWPLKIKDSKLAQEPSPEQHLLPAQKEVSNNSNLDGSQHFLSQDPKHTIRAGVVEN